MSDKVEIKVGVPWAFLIFFLFLALKLSGYITWSWWWVTSPLWLPITIIITFFTVGFSLYWFTLKAIERIDSYQDRKVKAKRK